MSYQEITKDTKDKMDKALHHVADHLRTIRTSRASPALVDGLRVDYYGQLTPLAQMAQISVPEPRQLAIKPFDASQIQEVAKAIQASGLGINPSVDGKIIRLTMPPLSEEQRKKLVALVKDKAEQSKVSIRAVRRDSNKHGDESLKNRVLTEDDHKKLKDEVQEQTKEHEKKIDDILKKKIDELMTV